MRVSEAEIHTDNVGHEAWERNEFSELISSHYNSIFFYEYNDGNRQPGSKLSLSKHSGRNYRKYTFENYADLKHSFICKSA